MPSDKKKLRNLLAKLAPESEARLLAQNLEDDIKNLESKIPTIPEQKDYSGVILSIRSELQILRSTILTKLDALPDKSSLDEIKKKYLEDIKVLNAKLDAEILKSKTDALKADSEIEKKFTELQKKLDKYRIETFSKGGGSMNQKISVNGTVMSNRYADINLLGSITKTDNNQTKQVDITFTSGSSQTPWLSNINGGGFSLSNVNLISTFEISVGDPLTSPLLEVNTSLQKIIIGDFFGSYGGGYLTIDASANTAVSNVPWDLGSRFTISDGVTGSTASSSEITLSSNTVGASGADAPIMHIVDDQGNFADIQPPHGRDGILPNDNIYWPTQSGVIAIVSEIEPLIHSQTAYAPVTGDTLTLSVDAAFSSKFFKPAGTIATLTLNFPGGQDGKTIKLMTSQQITALTLVPDGTDTILEPVTTLGINGFASYTFSQTYGYWFRSG